MKLEDHGLTAEITIEYEEAEWLLMFLNYIDREYNVEYDSKNQKKFIKSLAMSIHEYIET